MFKIFTHIHVLLLAVFLFATHTHAMIPMEIQKRVGIGALAIATNFAGYAGYEALSLSETPYKDVKVSLLCGLCSTWLTANLHLLRSLISGNNIKHVAKRGAALGAATFATQFFWSYMNSNLSAEPGESNSWRIAHKGLKGALWTTSILANLAILHQTLTGK